MGYEITVIMGPRACLERFQRITARFFEAGQSGAVKFHDSRDDEVQDNECSQHENEKGKPGILPYAEDIQPRDRPKYRQHENNDQTGGFGNMREK